MYTFITNKSASAVTWYLLLWGVCIKNICCPWFERFGHLYFMCCAWTGISGGGAREYKLYVCVLYIALTWYLCKLLVCYSEASHKISQVTLLAHTCKCQVKIELYCISYEKRKMIITHFLIFILELKPLRKLHSSMLLIVEISLLFLIIFIVTWHVYK